MKDLRPDYEDCETLFSEQTDRQTNERTFAFLELLSEPKTLIIN